MCWTFHHRTLDWMLSSVSMIFVLSVVIKSADFTTVSSRVNHAKVIASVETRNHASLFSLSLSPIDQAFSNEQYKTRKITNVLINNNVKSIKPNENVVPSVGLKNVYKLE